MKIKVDDLDDYQEYHKLMNEIILWIKCVEREKSIHDKTCYLDSIIDNLNKIKKLKLEGIKAG